MNEKIDSFKINHKKLLKGIYLSRIDNVRGENIITLDIRVKRPYVDTPLTPSVAHTIEHLGATFLRNSEYRDNVIYFGPMGCLTGFYLIYRGVPDSSCYKYMMIRMCLYILAADEIPGASEEECGNFRMNDLEGAKKLANEFNEELHKMKEENFCYPMA